MVSSGLLSPPDAQVSIQSLDWYCIQYQLHGISISLLLCHSKILLDLTRDTHMSLMLEFDIVAGFQSKVKHKTH